MMPTSKRLYLYLAVFVSGMTTLAVEFTASRLLGTVFSTSNIVWANIIGLMLLYLTVGYFIGGRWADRSPSFVTFYRILIWGAFLTAFIPLVARPVLWGARNAVVGADAGLAIGSFVAVLILFSLPVTLLGCVSPFAIRLALRGLEQSGQIAGHIYAISTLGSLIGTFVSVLWSIPQLGTNRTFLLFAAVLYAIGLFGLWRERSWRALIWLWMPVVVAILTALALTSPLYPPPAGQQLLYERESQYNYIQVVQDAGGNRYLYLNEGQGIHSQWSPDTLSDGNRTWSFFLAAPYFNGTAAAPQSLAIIGLAAGTIARQYTQVYGNIPIDGVEIDPAIVEAGAKYFDMNAQSMPNLHVYIEDGRYTLSQLNTRYAVIAVDAYRPPYIPWQLTTVEFFQEIRAHLLDDGVVGINVGRTNTDRRLVDAMTTTLLQVFPSVHALDVPRSFNTILVATMQPTAPSNLSASLTQLPSNASPLLVNALAQGIQSQVAIRTSDLIFTDDHAPIENLVDSLTLNFVMSDELNQIVVPGK